MHPILPHHVSRARLAPMAAAGLAAFVVLAVISFSTSPFFHEPRMWDSAVFQVIGKGWDDGLLPYVDLWDLKGPLIFFLNAVGYALTGSRLGVFLLQWASLTLTLLILLRLFRGQPRWLRRLMMALTLLSFGANAMGGNNVEEYLLPLLALSYAAIYRWCHHAGASPDHAPAFAFVYGMTLSFSLLTRLSNAVALCTAVAVIAAWLVWRRRWRNLLRNGAAFVAGFAVLAVPFLAWFWQKGALADMWYGTIVYNLDYAAHATPRFESLAEAVRGFASLADAWLLLATGVAMLVWRQRRMAAVMWTTVAAATLLWLLRGLLFPHYSLISLPFVAVSLLELSRLCRENKGKRVRRSAQAIVAAYAVVVSALFLNSCRLSLIYRQNADLQAFRAMMADVPQGYKQSFVAYNCPANWYVHEHIRPAVRFFVFQDFESDQSPAFRRRLQKAFDGRTEWILVSGKTRAIAATLRNRYRVYKHDDANNLTLYCAKPQDAP